MLLIPDEFLAKYVPTKTKVEIIAWKGRCEVHERFTAEDIAAMRAADPGIKILAHPECPPDVIEASDFAGSTAAMINYVNEQAAAEGGAGHRVLDGRQRRREAPDVEFVRPCNLCPHMKRISLENIYDGLLDMQHEVHVDPDSRRKARRAVERMVNLTN